MRDSRQVARVSRTECPPLCSLASTAVAGSADVSTAGSAERSPVAAAPCGVGSKNRTHTATTARSASITVTTCAGSESPACAAAAPIPAPATVPSENPAWKRGITDRPRRCSTTAPSRFMAASQTPTPMPPRNRPTRTSIGWSAPTARVATANPPALSPAKPTHVAPAPIREAIIPEVGSATSEPIAPVRSSTPICDSEKPSPSRTAGMRDAHVAMPIPATTKTAKTAQAARTACGGGVTDGPRGGRVGKLTP